jgi:hypothetical protein
MKRKLFAASAACVLLALGALPAYAQDTTPGEGLGGYDAQASALAISVQPVFPAFLPTGDAPFEATIALSTGHTKSGGNSFGRGSAIWPGNAASDPGPLLGQLFGPQIGALFPKWPVQAQANQDDGVVTAGAPPVLEMKAIGYPDRAYGDVRTGDVLAPGFVHVEHLASTSDTVVKDASVSSVARVTLQGISLANGYITIDQLRSISTTSSSGSSSTSSGDVDITGMKIGGIDVSVTDDGFQVTGAPSEAGDAPGAGGKPFPGQSPEEQVRQALATINGRITLFKGAGVRSGGQAQHYELGLVLSLDNPVGGQGPVPPGHFDIILGSTSSSALGSSLFAAGGTGATGGGGTGETGGSAFGGGSTGAEAPGAVSIGEGPHVGGTSIGKVGGDLGSGGATGAVGEPFGGIPQRSDYKFGGLPIGLVIGLLLVALVIARSIRNFLNTLMTAGDDSQEGV